MRVAERRPVLELMLIRIIKTLRESPLSCQVPNCW